MSELYVSVLGLQLLWMQACWKWLYRHLSIIQTLILFKTRLVTQWSVSGKMLLLCIPLSC